MVHHACSPPFKQALTTLTMIKIILAENRNQASPPESFIPSNGEKPGFFVDCESARPGRDFLALPTSTGIALAGW